jgi:hypothetical protein
MKMGKLAPKHSEKTLLLSDYQDLSVPPPPGKVWREYAIPVGQWGVLGNADYGDCTCACAGHIEMLMTAHTGSMYFPSLGDILAAYSAVSGFDAGPPVQNDNGAAISDVLEFWRVSGIAGRKILGWAQIDWQNINAVKQAIWLFGALDIGIQLPKSAMEQTNAGQTWEVLSDDGGILGGHSVPMFGYGSLGANCNTWGARQGMSWDWFAKYCDEAYAIITQDWINEATEKTPSGFDLATLQSDLAALTTLP